MKRTLGLAIVLGMLSSSQAVADMLPHLRLGREAERSDFIVVGEYLGGGRIKVSEVIKGDPAVREILLAKNPDTEDDPDRGPFPGKMHPGKGEKPRELATRKIVAFLAFREGKYYFPVSYASMKWIDGESVYAYQQRNNPGPYALGSDWRYPKTKDLMAATRAAFKKATRYKAVLALEKKEDRLPALLDMLMAEAKPPAWKDSRFPRLFTQGYLVQQLENQLGSDPDAVLPELVKRLKSATDSNTQVILFHTLMHHGFRRSSVPLKLAVEFAASHEGAVRAEALTLLERRGRPKDMILARKHLLDPSPEVRSQAMYIARYFRDPGAYTNLVKLFKRTKDPEMRNEIVNVLVECGNPKVVTLLMDQDFTRTLRATRYQWLPYSTGYDWPEGDKRWGLWFQKLEPFLEEKFDLDQAAEAKRFVENLADVDIGTRRMMLNTVLYPEWTQAQTHLMGLTLHGTPAEKAVALEAVALMWRFDRLTPAHIGSHRSQR